MDQQVIQLKALMQGISYDEFKKQSEELRNRRNLK